MTEVKTDSKMSKYQPCRFPSAHSLPFYFVKVDTRRTKSIESLFQKILGRDSQADFGEKSAKYGRGVGVGGG